MQLRALTWTAPVLLVASQVFAQSAPPTPEPSAPPVAAPTPPPAPAPAPVGSKFAAKLYGFVELDAIEDSTQSFADLAGNALIARPGSYAAEHRRYQMGVRNSRFGVKLTGPESEDVKTSALLEMDFFGNQPPNASEAAFFNNPTMRIRHAALKLETPIVDILAGQYWELFGWQSYFHPNSVQIQGLPGQVYSRTAQVRLSHAFESEPVTVEIAAAALRPVQRDADTPDGQAGLKLSINGWKGLHTSGSTGTSIDALALGISGLYRSFKVDELAAKPSASVKKNGWGVSFDALVPVVPATKDRKANALTLTGSFVKGAGIADMYSGLTGGITFPAPPNPGGATPAPTYTPNIDNGFVTYDANGKLHVIDWQSFIVGVQYYLPPSGSVWISANYSQMKSDDIGSYGTPDKVFKASRWADGNVFWDVNAAVRVGAEYAYFEQTYGDDAKAKNHRVQTSIFYIF